MLHSYRPAAVLAALCVCTVVFASRCSPAPPKEARPAATPAVHVDSPKVFDGTTLNGWKTVVPADWKVENGAIVGTVTAGGGWLVLETVCGGTGLEASVE